MYPFIRGVKEYVRGARAAGVTQTEMCATIGRLLRRVPGMSREGQMQQIKAAARAMSEALDEPGPPLA